MGSLDGVWTPESEAETEFLFRMNEVVQDAYYGQGLPQAQIAGALAFMAASVAMSEPSEGPPEVPTAPEQTDACPECETPIEDVRVFMGGRCVVEPCGCAVHMDDLDGWVETPEITEVGDE